MPCIKCNNGKYKYGMHGRCQFDTLEKCRAAEQAIHIQEGGGKGKKPKMAAKLNKSCDGCGHGCDCHECRRNRIKQKLRKE